MANRGNNNNEETKEKETPPAAETPSPTTSIYTMLAGRVASLLNAGAPLNVISGATSVELVSEALGTPRTIAGAMVFDFIPTLGQATKPTDPVNRAADMLFNDIRSKISGTRPYERSDLMIYTCANVDLRNLYALLRRMYTLHAEYEGLNYYYPKKLFEALGWDYEDFVKHAADIYFWLVAHTGVLRYFPITDSNGLYADHMMFNSMFFTDGDITRSQIYAFRQVAFWSYEKVDQYGGLTPVKLTGTTKLITWEDFTTMWDRLYEAYVGSDDVSIIAADIRRAYPDNLITDLVPPAANELVPIVKIDTILDAIMNMQIHSEIDINSTADLNEFRIKDGVNGYLHCSPILRKLYADLPIRGFGTNTSSVVAWGETRPYLNCIYDAADPEFVARAMRFKPYVHVTFSSALTTQKDVTFYYEHFGTEIIVAARTVNMNGMSIPTNEDMTQTVTVAPINDFASVVGVYGWKSGAAAGSALAAANVIKGLWWTLGMLSEVSRFDWAPSIRTVCVSKSQPQATFDSPMAISDTQNVIPISESNFRQSFEAQLLTVLSLPATPVVANR